MADRRIPLEVEAFILKNIHSIEQLEVLLLLQRDPTREWNEEEVSTALRSNPASAQARLKDLQSRNLVIENRSKEQHTYHAVNGSNLAKLVEDVALYYGTHRHLIITLIYSRPTETLRILADAFLIWKDEK